MNKEKYNSFKNKYNTFAGKIILVKKIIKKIIYPFYPILIYIFASTIAVIAMKSLNNVFKGTVLENEQYAWYIFNSWTNVFLIIYFFIWYLLKFRLNKKEKESYGYKKLTIRIFLYIGIFFVSFNLALDSIPLFDENELVDFSIPKYCFGFSNEYKEMYEKINNHLENIVKNLQYNIYVPCFDIQNIDYPISDFILLYIYTLNRFCQKR